MKYLGLQTQIRRNNLRSTFLLIAFPALLLTLSWFFFFFLSFGKEDAMYQTNDSFIRTGPFILIAVLIWFTIAWFSHNSMIRSATGSHSLDRKDNKRVYNLVENLCISRGMKMPKVNVIEDNSLNAFASGINENSYTVSLSRGIINKLDDEELKAVIAHELTHIQNKDVRLLIISIIFVGIFAFLSEMGLRSIQFGGRRKGKGGEIMILIMVLAAIGYLLSTLFRFALSRKREYLADAGAVEMTKNAPALASALRKISQDPDIEAVKREDVAQLFIEHPSGKKKKGFLSSLSGLFATHPPIEERIAILEQF